MDKVRFGVVGTNFISDWVIAGARQDDVLTGSCIFENSGDGGCFRLET